MVEKPVLKLLTSDPVAAAFVRKYWQQASNGLFVNTYASLAKEFGYRKRDVAKLVSEYCEAWLDGGTCVDCNDRCRIANVNEYFLVRAAIRVGKPRCASCLKEFRLSRALLREHESRAAEEERERRRAELRARYGPRGLGTFDPLSHSLASISFLLAMTDAGLGEPSGFLPVRCSRSPLTHHLDWTTDCLTQLLHDGVIGYDSGSGDGDWISDEAQLLHPDFLFGLSLVFNDANAEWMWRERLLSASKVESWPDKWLYEAQGLYSRVLVSELWRILRTLCREHELVAPSVREDDWTRLYSALHLYPIGPLRGALTHCLSEAKLQRFASETDQDDLIRDAVQASLRLLGHARVRDWRIPYGTADYSHLARVLSTALFSDPDALWQSTMGDVETAIAARLRA